ncbi:MAG: DUF4301 family protein, partial [Ulvibacter sp.]|nr:DUF4301 family protein [Ulvibacter sp.]
MFIPQELDQIISHGLTQKEVKKQLQTFKDGAPFTHVSRHAGVGNGVEVYDVATQKQLAGYYDDIKEQKDIIKFVPASGAATRMFKFLHTFLDNYDPDQEKLTPYLKSNALDSLKTFIDNIKYFPFTTLVQKEIRSHRPEYKKSKKGYRINTFVALMLGKNHLNYGAFPKGLIPFHKYAKYTRTAFEEQLFEATQYAALEGVAHLHFTFSPKHLHLFKETFEKVKNRIVKKTKVDVRISYSFQDPSTDTIAVDLKNKPFKNKEGNLVF